MVRTAPQSTDKLRGRAGLRREGGQALVMVVLFLFVLLGMAAMVIDVGYAFYAQRSLQAQVDAAALAGAQELPDPSRAEAIAYEYSGQSGGKSERGNVRDVTVEVRTRCLTKIPGCDPGERGCRRGARHCEDALCRSARHRHGGAWRAPHRVESRE